MSALTLAIDTWGAAMIRVGLQGTLFLALAMLVEGLWRQMPATFRSWLWRLVFVKVAFLALCGATIPLPLLPRQTTASVAIVRSTPMAQVVDEPGTTPVLSTLPRSGPWAISSSRVVVSLLFASWLLGVVAGTIHFARQWREVQRRISFAKPAQHPFLSHQLRTLAAGYRLSALPEIRLLNGGGSPCVTGGRKPIMLLPQAWLKTCTAEQLRLAIAHELAHLERGDLLWNGFVAACRVALFFHPLVWWGARRQLAAQELACDERALGRTGSSPAVLAGMLLQGIETSAATSCASAAAMIGAGSTVRERIVAMSREFGSPAPATAALFTLAAALLLAPFSLAEQGESESPSSSSTKKVETKSGGQKSFSGGAASGSASASGGGGGRTFSSATAEARAITSGDGQGKTEKPATESPGDSVNPPAKKSGSSTSSRVQQKMTSTNDGSGEKWTRTTTAEENGREITIEESEGHIRVVIKNMETGKEVVTEAKNAEELLKKSAAAHGVYRRYVGPKGTVKAAVGAGQGGAAAGGGAIGKAGGAADGDGGINLGEFGLPNLPDGLKAPDAKALLKEQLRELRNNAEVRGTPLEELLEQVEREVDAEK